MLKVAIIIGSTRPGRKAEVVARWVYDIASKRSDAAFEIVDIKDFDLPLLDEPVLAAMGLGRVKTFRPRETGDATLNLACCHNCELESTWFARSAVSDLVAPTRTPHVWIAAMRGFTPRMFMTRVRL